MANQGYRTITGNAQGVISAGCSTQESIGNTYQTTHTDEIMVPPYSHNMTNVGNINKQTHHPIPTTKNVNKSSPLLAQALSIREEINRIISFYPALSFGKLEKLYSISINDGIFADQHLKYLTPFCYTIYNRRICRHPLSRYHADPPFCRYPRI